MVKVGIMLPQVVPTEKSVPLSLGAKSGSAFCTAKAMRDAKVSPPPIESVSADCKRSGYDVIPKAPPVFQL